MLCFVVYCCVFCCVMLCIVVREAAIAWGKSGSIAISDVIERNSDLNMSIEHAHILSAIFP
jgi:hypothetical protein